MVVNIFEVNVASAGLDANNGCRRIRDCPCLHVCYSAISFSTVFQVSIVFCESNSFITCMYACII